MEITGSARRHGIADADIVHAWDHAIRFVVDEYGGENQLLVIGPDRTGQLLELVAVPFDEPVRIIHAMRMRRQYLRYL